MYIEDRKCELFKNQNPPIKKPFPMLNPDPIRSKTRNREKQRDGGGRFKESHTRAFSFLNLEPWSLIPANDIGFAVL